MRPLRTSSIVVITTSGGHNSARTLEATNSMVTESGLSLIRDLDLTLATGFRVADELAPGYETAATDTREPVTLSILRISSVTHFLPNHDLWMIDTDQDITALSTIAETRNPFHFHRFAISLATMTRDDMYFVLFLSHLFRSTRPVSTAVLPGRRHV